MGDSRFTIAMQENRTNSEGKFLPVSYAVTTWNQAGALHQTEIHFNSWKRVGPFDLPAVIRVVTAVPTAQAVKASSPPVPKDGISARSMTLSNHKLLEAGAAK
jgi:hypothetical protein